MAKRKQELPGTAIDAIDDCDKEMFPTIYSLLQILATLPVRMTSAECTFYTLHHLKTWLRARMSEERLIGLCLVHVHRDIAIDVDSVIEESINTCNKHFAKSGNRRLDFVI